MSFAKSPERLAWLTIWGAFAVLVVVSCMVLLSGRWFLFNSRAQLDAQLYVGRGTVGVRDLNSEQQVAVRTSYQLGRDETIATDEIAQGYIAFIDTNDGNRVIANAIILAGSQARVLSATRSRFRLAENNYRLRLGDFEGRMEVEIPSGLSRQMHMVIEGTHGTVTLTESGYYLIWSLPDTMTVIPRTQSVQLNPATDQPLTVAAGYTATVNSLTQTVSFIKTTDELIANPSFDLSTQKGVPDSWGCYSTVERADAPHATERLYTFQGRRTLHFERKGERLGASEIGCRQFFGQAGLDVTTYRTLRLRATVNIGWHSLSACGFQGSECALMVELTYLNEAGLEQRWIHGFYAYDHGNANVPLTCNSCLLDHDRITPSNWYTFESGNFFTLPTGFRPTKLLQIRFYTSGHEYDVAVSEIAILAEQ